MLTRYSANHGPSSSPSLQASVGTAIYFDGVPVKKTSQFRLSPEAFSGRLIVGDAPGQSDSWAGQLLGLAIYHTELTESQVSHNYLTWKQQGHPEITEGERNIALYLFDEHSGNIVRDKTGSGVDLYIPERYTVVDQIFLEPFWHEFEMTRSYWSATAKNIVGHSFRLLFLRLLGDRTFHQAGNTRNSGARNRSQPYDRNPAGIPSHARLRHHRPLYEYARRLDWRRVI